MTPKPAISLKKNYSNNNELSNDLSFTKSFVINKRFSFLQQPDNNFVLDNVRRTKQNLQNLTFM